MRDRERITNERITFPLQTECMAEKVMKLYLNWKEHVGRMSDSKEGQKLTYVGEGLETSAYGKIGLKAYRHRTRLFVLRSGGIRRKMFI